MNYDALEYEKQIRALKTENDNQNKYQSNAEFLCGLCNEDRLIPTYTICLYHGKEQSDGTRSLNDMMHFEEKD